MGFLSCKSLSAFVVLICGLFFQEKLLSLYYDLVSYLPNEKVGYIYTVESLRMFDGVSNEKVYLALLGHVFDVTNGRKHYSKDSPYHYFVGKDSSRSFITGDFQDESADRDHVLDLNCEELATLDHWVNTFRQKYKFIGILHGRYFNKYGKETEYAKQLQIKRNHCKIEKNKAEIEKLKYPSCNMEWSADNGSRVWCSKNSGGTSRSWVGVPRQLYTPGSEHSRCVCISPDHVPNSDRGLLKEYDGCAPTLTSCNINS